MNILATIGQVDTSIQYTDRPTVKVVIKNNSKVLVLNKGLLPGGGIDPGETDQDAITRELQEELGVTVKDALAFVTESIEEAQLKPMDDDANQGKLYNLMATFELLKTLE